MIVVRHKADVGPESKIGRYVEDSDNVPEARREFVGSLPRVCREFVESSSGVCQKFVGSSSRSSSEDRRKNNQHTG